MRPATTKCYWFVDDGGNVKTDYFVYFYRMVTNVFAVTEEFAGMSGATDVMTTALGIANKNAEDIMQILCLKQVCIKCIASIAMRFYYTHTIHKKMSDKIVLCKFIQGFNL